MDHSSTGKNDLNLISHETVSELSVDAFDIDYDENFLYAACRDQRIRVWSKTNWELIAELGETGSDLLAVDVDDEQVYATCEKRVYVWKKDTWGMIGWFELSYQAVTSRLQGDFFFVGARDGRLVSIQKDTHETSSWQLHKSDLTSIWSDEKIICTSTKKEEPKVWLKESDAAPSELARLDKKGKGGIVSGNSEFVFIGTPSGEIAVYERTAWELVRTFEVKNANVVTSMWTTENYLLGAVSPGNVTLWDLKKGDELGSIALDNQKIDYLTAEGDLIYVATADCIHILRIMASGHPLDLHSTYPLLLRDSLLKTSPYDVLESALELQRKGDEQYQEGLFHEAVGDFEKALQILIDNTQALQEVPEERKMLTNDLNTRLGKALLKAKMQELQSINHDISQLSEELEVRKRTDMNPEDVERLWAVANRAIKESRVLAEAQASDMLSFQLSHVIDTLESDFTEAMARYDQYRETINHASALIRNISNEWRWLERKRSNLSDRKEYLEKAIEKISNALEEAETEGEVHRILSGALQEYKKIHEQIERILSSYDPGQESTFTSRDEAEDAIEGLLSMLPKKREELTNITNPADREKELQRIRSALQQALEAAKSFKISNFVKSIESELASLDEE
ncbi:MAG: hypothetical protein JW779_02945 [Candidatus Thorarchaeota archaeon]|nr:hypothetical protein [Candidatus Thorarchaeota archaeon]